MKKVLRISMTALSLAALAFLSAPSVHATCANSTPTIGTALGSSIDLGAAAADASLGDGVTPIQAAYWRVNAGNTAIAAGSDNGSWGIDGANGGIWFADLAGTGVYSTFGVDDHNGPSDGCINGPDDNFQFPPTADDVIAIGACGPDGKFFVELATNDPGGVYDFGPGPYVAANSPQIVVTGSNRITPGVGTGVQIFFTTPSASDFASNFSNGGTSVTVNTIFTGVNVYTACVPRGNSAPARLVPSAGWALAAGSPFPLGAAGQSVTRDCGPGTWDVFVGTEPKFDGTPNPFTAGCVTGTTRPVQAGSTLANPSDPAPRTIKKPRGIRPSDPN